MRLSDTLSMKAFSERLREATAQARELAAAAWGHAMPVRDSYHLFEAESADALPAIRQSYGPAPEHDRSGMPFRGAVSALHVGGSMPAWCGLRAQWYDSTCVHLLVAHPRVLTVPGQNRLASEGPLHPFVVHAPHQRAAAVGPIAAALMERIRREGA